MTTVTINYIEFNPSVTIPTAVDIYYKQKSLPDISANWVNVITDLMVNPSGFISGGLNIILQDNTEYTIRVYNKCGSYYDEDIISSSINNIVYNSVTNENLSLRIVAYTGFSLGTATEIFYEHNQVSLPNNNFTATFPSNGVTNFYMFISPVDGYISGYVTIKINGVQIHRSRVDNGKLINNIIIPGALINNIEIEFLQTYWEEVDVSCQKNGLFSIVKQIDPLVSPVVTAYDETTGLAYIFDRDRIEGNIGWFNPLTATNPSDITWSDKVTQINLFSGNIDLERRKIFCQGANSYGLIVYDIDTDTITTNILFGPNSSLARSLLASKGNQFYTRDTILGNMYIINKDTYQIDNTIPFTDIPSSQSIADRTSISLVFHNNDVWMIPANKPALNEMNVVRIYNSDMTILKHSLLPPGVMPYTASSYGYHSTIVPGNRIFLIDRGSKNVYVYSLNDYSLLHQFALDNSREYSHVITTLRQDVYSGLYVIACSYFNSLTTIGFVNSYYIDIDTYEIKSFLKNEIGPNVRVSGTDFSYSVFPGALAIDNGTEWQFDGYIQVFTNDAPGGNSGMVAVDNILEKYLVSNIPTGIVKGNIPGDGDYIQPYFDRSICEVDMNLLCPEVIFTYNETTSEIILELSFLNSVTLNSSINRIRIIALNALDEQIGLQQVVNAPLPNYVKRIITSATDIPVKLRLEYLGSDEGVLETCDLIN